MTFRPVSPRAALSDVGDRPGAGAAVRCPTGCGGFIEPTTNGQGQVIDLPCPVCARRVAPQRRKVIERCRVDGCPGTVHVLIEGTSRRELRPCPYCERRRAWEALALEHGLPAPTCIICSAPIAVRESPGRQEIICPVCKPIRERIRTRAEAKR